MQVEGKYTGKWLFLVLLALAAGCGEAGDATEMGTQPTPQEQAGSPYAGPGTSSAGGGSRSGTASGGKGGSGEARGSEEQGGRPIAGVDLGVDVGSIKGARVTPTGAVQTRPPDSGDRQAAQENSYASIRQFGSEAEGEEATNISFALVQYLNAKAEGDWATACARLYSVLRETFERDGAECVQAYGATMSRSSEAGRAEQAKIDISSIRRGEGNRAFVIYKTPDTLSADMPLYVEDGVWKVAALDAYILTPEQLAGQ